MRLSCEALPIDVKMQGVLPFLRFGPRSASTQT